MQHQDAYRSLITLNYSQKKLEEWRSHIPMRNPSKGITNPLAKFVDRASSSQEHRIFLKNTWSGLRWSTRTWRSGHGLGATWGRLRIFVAAEVIVPALCVGMPLGTLRVPPSAASVGYCAQVTPSVTGCIPTRERGNDLSLATGPSNYTS